MNQTFRRQNKHDRIINPGASAAEIQCDYAVAPLTRVADGYDLTWGADRLPELVSVELAAKYGKAVAHLHDCIDRESPADTAGAANNCIKGLHAMDAHARAAEHQPKPVEAWEATHEGQRVAVIRDVRDQVRAVAAFPSAFVVTMNEVAVALHHYRYALVNADIVKAAFPGAEITAIRNCSKLEDDMDDEIPF